MKPSSKRAIAIVGLLGSFIGLKYAHDHSPVIWASLAALLISFYSIYRYTSQMREEQGLPSMAPVIVGFVIRFVICTVIVLVLFLGLCLLLVHYHYYAHPAAVS